MVQSALRGLPATLAVGGGHERALAPLLVLLLDGMVGGAFAGILCNTLGVCHQLSNGFELQHDKFSGNQEL